MQANLDSMFERREVVRVVDVGDDGRIRIRSQKKRRPDWEELIEAEQIPGEFRAPVAEFVVLSKHQLRIKVETVDGRSWAKEIGIDELHRWKHDPSVSNWVARSCGRLIRFEPYGDAWLTIQDRMRPILCDVWDPIHVGIVVRDEYDGYIADLYDLMQGGADHAGLVAFLLEVETRVMGMHRNAAEPRNEAARRLLELDLPVVRRTPTDRV